MTNKPVKTVDYKLLRREFQMRFYALDINPPDEAKELIEFYQLWHNLRGERKIPARECIKFEVLKGWHSNIRLVHLGKNESSPKQNLILGEFYKKYWGTDTMYNMFVVSPDSDDDNRQKYLESIQCFMNYNYAVSIGHAPSADGSLQRIAWIDLPLSDGKSDEISYLLTALITLIN